MILSDFQRGKLPYYIVPPDDKKEEIVIKKNNEIECKT